MASVLCVLSLHVGKKKHTHCAADKSTGSDHRKPPPGNQREPSRQVDAEVLAGVDKKCRRSGRRPQRQTERVNRRWTREGGAVMKVKMYH